MTRAGLTADRVARAAADLADEVGFENITVSELARQFGVADASLYSHVKNVRELRIQVAKLATHWLAEHLSAAIAGQAGKAALVAFAHAYRQFALTHPGRYSAALMPLPDDAVAGSSDHRRIMACTYVMLLSYELAEPDLTDAVRLLRSALHGHVSLEGSVGFGGAREMQASWERVIDALHVVLENWPSSPPDTPHPVPGASQERQLSV